MLTHECAQVVLTLKNPLLGFGLSLKMLYTFGFTVFALEVVGLVGSSLSLSNMLLVNYNFCCIFLVYVHMICIHDCLHSAERADRYMHTCTHTNAHSFWLLQCLWLMLGSLFWLFEGWHICFRACIRIWTFPWW